MCRTILILPFIFIIQFTKGQNAAFKIPDSLKDKEYEYLDDKIYLYKKDSAKATIYLFTYLTKAKKEHNWKETVNGYQNLVRQSPSHLKLIYADSMIYAAKKSNDNSLIGSAYLSKGIVYYVLKKQNEALDLFLTANSYISKTTDNYLIYKVKYHIALIKFYLGFYDEAVSLFRQCISYFKEENHRAYLNSLHCLGLAYNKTADYGLCSQTNALGISECTRLNILEMKAYFIHSEGINNYFKQNYGIAAKDIESTLGDIQQNNDFANISIGNFYIGKSYWAQNKKEKALPYFKEVDKIFNEKEYIRPDLRQVYEILIKYYKGKNDLKNQSYYVDQLLKADSVLIETNRYLIGKVHKEYDTVTLVSEKEKIRLELLRKNNYDIYFAGTILILFVLSLFLTYRHFKNRNIYKKKFDALMKMSSDEKNSKPKVKSSKSELLDINEDTVAIILKQLKKFENDKKFLERDWTLGTLSAFFNSNSKYLSAIISHYRGKRFVDYINDLRIDYIISLLQNETKFRNYTNSALAEEAGFSSTQRFSLCFKAKTGMPVNFFIEQIKK